MHDDDDDINLYKLQMRVLKNMMMMMTILTSTNYK
jgi:hypothetical protein